MSKPPLFIGFNTEYYQISENENEVLSWQFSLHDPDLDRRYDEVIFPPCAGTRLTLGQLLSDVLTKADYRPSELQECRSPQKFLGREIILILHNGVAALSTLKDRIRISRLLKDLGEAPVTLRPFEQTVVLGTKRLMVRVTWRDTMNLSPQGNRSLKHLGESIGLPKRELPEGYSKDNMACFLQERPREYRLCTLRDAEIAREYAQRIYAVTALYGSEMAAVSVSAASAHAFVSACGGPNEVEAVIGYRVKGVRSRSKARHQRMSPPALIDHEATVIRSFIGAHSVAYFHGRARAKSGEIIADLDLKNAYPSALCALPSIDWGRRPEEISEIPHFCAGDPLPLVLADVTFTFPENYPYPSLPIRYEDALAFVQRGDGLFTAAEIEMARRAGAEVRVLRAWRWFPRDAEHYPLAGFIGKLIRDRKQFSKGSSGEQVRKLLANSLYGKLGQGLRDNSHRNLGTGMIEQVPTCPITNPLLATLVTGLVRATIGETLLIAHRKGWKVLEAITDGLMIVADHLNPVQTVEEELAKTPCGALLLQARRSIGENDILEEKSRGTSALVVKTRMAILYNSTGKVVKISRAGIRWDFPEELSIEAEETSEAAFQQYQAGEIERLFDAKVIETITTTKQPSLGDLIKKDCAKDYIAKKDTRSASVCFDFKRQLQTNGDTIPWQNIDKFRTARESARQSLKRGIKPSWKMGQGRWKGDKNKNVPKVVTTKELITHTIQKQNIIPLLQARGTIERSVPYVIDRHVLGEVSQLNKPGAA